MSSSLEAFVVEALEVGAPSALAEYLHLQQSGPGAQPASSLRCGANLAAAVTPLGNALVEQPGVRSWPEPTCGR
jgi:hypothetical protein